ncbi:MAG: caspase family protein [Deltaproteobacteria bacterium]|nr:caspase family protein [Deltaproteobacteria bacterium]
MKSGFIIADKIIANVEDSMRNLSSTNIAVQSHDVQIKSDVDELPAVKAKPNKNSYAIVIGIESYRQKLPKSDFSIHDAQTMTEYLTKVMGYPEENVVTLTNEHAAKSDFEKYFEKWLFNNVEKDGSVFIYYSGHGAPNPKTGDAFLVPYDGDPSFIDQTGYSLKRLYEALGKLPTKEIIVALDSCFSGAGGRSVIAKGARPLVMTMEKTAVPSNIAVLSAASGEQISSTYEEKGHGLFTYFMLKGLKSDGDANGDGKIEIGELFDYIKPQVERIARKTYNNEQSPQLIAPNELIKHKLIER